MDRSAKKFTIGKKFKKPGGTSSSSGSGGTATTSTSSGQSLPQQSSDQQSTDSQHTSPRSENKILSPAPINEDTLTRSPRFRLPSLSNSVPKSPPLPPKSPSQLASSPSPRPQPLPILPRDSPGSQHTSYTDPSIGSPPSTAKAGTKATSLPLPTSSTPDVSPHSTPKPAPAILEHSSPKPSALKLENLDASNVNTVKSRPKPGTLDMADKRLLPAPIGPALEMVPPPSGFPVFGADRVSKLAPFEDEIKATQKVVDRMRIAHTALVVVAAALEAAEWLPVIGSCVGIVAELVDTAAKATMNKVSALHLVERAAVLIEAIERAIQSKAGVVPSAWQGNLTDLLETLNEIAFLLSKLSKRSFLKLYMKSDEMNIQIERASVKLEDCVRVFELQSFIEIAAWQEQTKRDFHADFQALTARIEEAMNDDKAMLQIVCEKNDQLQESVKALQRRIEFFMQMYEAEWHAHHPLLVIRPESDSNQFFESIPSPTSSPPAPGSSRPPPAWHNRMAVRSGRPTIQPLTQLDARRLSGSPIPGTPSTGSPRVMSHPPPPDLQVRKDFYEKAIKALRSVSGAESDVDIPDWTITSLEVTKDERISTGNFSVVWKGMYGDKVVAIKELNEGAERQMFIREVNVWRNLRSPFILEFLGASSTTDPPPWFLVSPYMRRGNIMNFLGSDEGKRVNKLALVHQVSQGLEYLHSCRVIHGDFKGNNVLINDEGHALICDFGLSEIKLDIARKSGTDVTVESACSGTLRWQSPERMLGGKLTRQVDVYAFGMTIYEIYSLSIPFFHFDASMVRHDVKKGKRPRRADGIPDELWILQNKCWAQASSERPSFEVISAQLARMYTVTEAERKSTATSDSQASASSSSSEEDQFFDTQTDPEEQTVLPTVLEPHVEPGEDHHSSSSSSSVYSADPPTGVTDEGIRENDRTERLYRHSLRDDHADLLAVALWNPIPVKLGTVGYFRHGTFHELYDANLPTFKTSQPPMPTLSLADRFNVMSEPVNARSPANNVWQRLLFRSTAGVREEEGVARQYPFPLLVGRSTAALVIEDGRLERYRDKDLSVTKEYLKANIDWILDNFGLEHKLSREDVAIVFGTLSARRWAMFVSTFKPRTKVNFNVWQQQRDGGPWGTWAASSDIMSTGYQHKISTKVSTLSPLSVPDAVMIGRWQFVLGSPEPFLGAT